MAISVTGLERTFVDVLNRPDLAGSWEEIWRSLESVEYFDLEKVASYVDFLGNATTAAKVGFFLEQHRESLMVDETYMKTLYEDGGRADRIIWSAAEDRQAVLWAAWTRRSRRGLRKNMGGTTVKISPETLIKQAETTGFRPDMLEKVGLLLQLLDTIRSHPFLKNKLVLKGGTALNLFIFDVPRLSIDIDLNYVGAADRGYGCRTTQS